MPTCIARPAARAAVARLARALALLALPWMAAGPGPAPAGEIGLSKPVGQPGAPLRTRWTSAMGDAVIKDLFLPPADIERRPPGASPAWMPPEFLFLITEDHRLGCMDRLTGNLRWMMRMPGDLVGGRPAITRNGVYFVSRQRLFGLELWSGELMFDITLPFASVGGLAAVDAGRSPEDSVAGRGSASIAVALRAVRAQANALPEEASNRKVGDLLYLAGADNSLRQMEIILEQWPSPYSVEYKSLSADLRRVRHRALTRWNVRLDYGGLPAGSVMVGSPGCVFLVISSHRDHSAHMVAFDANRMERAVPYSLPAYRIQRPVAAPPLSAGGLVLAPGLDGILYAVSGVTNQPIWKYAAGDSLRMPPQYAEDPMEQSAEDEPWPDGPAAPGVRDRGGAAEKASGRLTSGVMLDREKAPRWRPAKRRSMVLQKVGDRGPLVAIRLADGQEAWPAPFASGKQAVALMEDPNMEPARRVFFVVQNDDRTLSGVRMSDGYEVWRAPFDGGSLFSANSRTDLAYAVMDGGRGVMALERTP